MNSNWNKILNPVYRHMAVCSMRSGTKDVPLCILHCEKYTESAVRDALGEYRQQLPRVVRDYSSGAAVNVLESIKYRIVNIRGIKGYLITGQFKDEFHDIHNVPCLSKSDIRDDPNRQMIGQFTAGCNTDRIIQSKIANIDSHTDMLQECNPAINGNTFGHLGRNNSAIIGKIPLFPDAKDPTAGPNIGKIIEAYAEYESQLPLEVDGVTVSEIYMAVHYVYGWPTLTITAKYSASGRKSSDGIVLDTKLDVNKDIIGLSHKVENYA